MSEVRFRIQKPHVIREQFDDEVVVVNLNSGIYYSLDTVGAVVWAGLERELAFEALVGSVTARYAGDFDEITREVRDFLTRLEREDLIVTHQGSSQTKAETELPPSSGEKSAFVPPTLNKYTDMQDLLLLDPIHEVDETGWPTAKAEATAK